MHLDWEVKTHRSGSIQWIFRNIHLVVINFIYLKIFKNIFTVDCKVGCSKNYWRRIEHGRKCKLSLS